MTLGLLVSLLNLAKDYSMKALEDLMMYASPRSDHGIT